MYWKGYKPSVKKDKKHNANREYWNKEKDKTKSHTLFSTNSQPQTQVFKKVKCYRS